MGASFMLIAGEASGDLLAAELVQSLRASAPAGAGGDLKFFGAGGPQMAAAGVELIHDLTSHSVIGLWEAVRHYARFKSIFDQLIKLAFERQPSVIICVDFSGFNRRFAARIRKEYGIYGKFKPQWKPRLVQYVSPQVWASRPGRARSIERDFDLLLSLFPFEKEWYAQRTPKLHVEFVGHPLFDRYPRKAGAAAQPPAEESSPLVVLLPGSRVGEVKRHAPVLWDAWGRIAGARPRARVVMVLPNERLADLAGGRDSSRLSRIKVGGLSDWLSEASLALACTGTVTLECAYFGVPTVAFYKTSWSTYWLGRLLVRVPYLAMPNLLAREPVFPEFIQHKATGENLAHAAIELLNDRVKRLQIKIRLMELMGTLGGPGASRRAADAIWRLLSDLQPVS